MLQKYSKDQQLKDSFVRPLNELTGLPNIAYCSAEFAQFERDHVLSKSWFCIANEAQLARAGWAHPVDILGLPLVVVKDKTNVVRVFHNVCSHRGMRLVDEARGVGSIIACRYHGWCYSTAGDLKSTPHIAGEGEHLDERFCKVSNGLKSVRSHIFAGMIFVNLSGDAEDFSTFISPVLEHWSEIDFKRYSHGGADSVWEITLITNWKLAQENHVDGYHLPFVHPDLHRYSPLRNHYPLLLEGSASGQGSTSQNHADDIGVDQLPMNPDLSEPWHQGKAEFLSVFPNIMMAVHADHLWTVQLIPVAENITVERMDLCYFKEGATDEKYAELRRNNRDRMLAIFEEDRAMVEGMQKGRQSPAFNGGSLSPTMDQPAHCFIRIVAKAVLNAIGKE